MHMALTTSEKRIISTSKAFPTFRRSQNCTARLSRLDGKIALQAASVCQTSMGTSLYRIPWNRRSAVEQKENDDYTSFGVIGL